MEPLPNNLGGSATAVPPAEIRRKEDSFDTTLLLRADNTKEQPEEIAQHHVPMFLPPEETIELKQKEEIGYDQDDIILDETEHDHDANAVTQPTDSDHLDHGVSTSSGDAPPAQLSQATPYAHEAQALIEQAQRQQQQSQQLEQQQHLKDEASEQEILSKLQQQLEQQEQQYQAKPTPPTPTTTTTTRSQ
ncbi:hypothetical protein ACA910_021616 [Epithemia clementina (nom. ined.)]